MSGLIRVVRESARGGLYLFVGNFLSTLISAVAVIVIARLLGPGGYGLYSVSLIAPGLLVLLTDFGVSQGLTKYLAQFKAEGRGDLIPSIIRAGLLFNLSVSLLVLALSLPFSGFLASSVLRRPELGFTLQIALLLILGQSSLMTLNGLFIGLDHMEYVASLSVGRSVVRAVAAPLLILAGLSVAGAVLGLVIAAISTGLAGLYLALRLYRRFRSTYPNGGEGFNTFKTLIGYGFPLYLASILAGLTSQYRSLVLAWFASDFEIGNYGTAVNFSALIGLLSYPISTALFPAFSKIDLETGRGDISLLFRYSVKYTSLLIVPASVFVMVFSKSLVYLIYGSKYVLAPTYLALYMITFLYTGFGQLVLQAFFNGIGETRITFKMGLLNTAFSLLTAPLLTALLGVQGLILSILVSTFISLLYGLHSSRRFKVNFDFKSSIKIYASSLASGALTFTSLKLLSFNNSLLDLIIFGAIFLASYLTAIPLTKAIDRGDLRDLEEIFMDVKPIYPMFKPVLRFERLISRIFDELC